MEKNKTIILLIFIPFILLCVGYFFFSDISTSVVSTYYNKSDLYNYNPEHSRNNKLELKFKSKLNNLGIITIKFTNDAVRYDIINFKIREKDASSWYYQGKINTEQFFDNPNYLFGFPVILNSKNKIYEVEIESQKNKISDIITLSKENPILISKHLFNKKILLTDTSQLKDYFKYKTYSIIVQFDFWLKLAFIYIFFLFCFVLHKQEIFIINFRTDVSNLKHECRSKILVYLPYYKKKFIILFFLILSVTFIFKTLSDKVILVLVLIWVISLVKYKVDATLSFLTGIFFLIFLAISNLLKIEILRQLLSIWAFIFLIIGTFQLLIHENKKLFVRMSSSSIFKFLDSYLNSIFIILNKLTKIIFNKIKYFISTGKPWTRKNFWFLLPRVLITLLVLLSITILSFVLISKKQEANNRASLNPQIVKIEPQLVYKSTKVIIWGRELGWNHERAMLKSQFGKIQPDVWTDTKIIFTVPQHWKEGPIYLIIEKPSIYKGQKIITKSELKNIELIPISTSSFSSKDDAFFEQLKTLDKETLEINGYERDE